MNLNMDNNPSVLKIKARYLTHPIISHPSVVFSCLWGLSLTLVSLKLVDAFSNHIDAAFILFCLVVISNVIGAITAAIVCSNINFPVKKKPISFLNVRKIFYIWLIVSVIEIFTANGLPIVWLLTGDSRTYADFGLPTLHGFANAMWLFLSFAQFVKVIDEKFRPQELLILLLLIFWPILVVSRALFTIWILQISFYLLISSPKKLRNIFLPNVALIIVFLYFFGIAGDLRSSFSITSSLGFDQEYVTLTAFLWAYAYIVSPLMNLALAWATIQPSYHYFPENMLSELMPNVVKNILGFDRTFEGFAVLTHDAFNAITAFGGAYYDWGPFGVSLMAFLIGLVGHFIWRGARNSANLPLLAAYCACTALTIFTNQFTQLVPIVYMLMLAKLTTCKSYLVMRK